MALSMMAVLILARLILRMLMVVMVVKGFQCRSSSLLNQPQSQSRMSRALPPLMLLLMM
jgi:hypothetical protein